jgi:hypothetical protein
MSERRGYVCEYCGATHSPLTDECICGGSVIYTELPPEPAHPGTPAPRMGRAAARIAYRRAHGLPTLVRDDK